MFKPMLAATITAKQLHILDYPVYTTPKIDGIRCVLYKGKALTRSLKPIPNKYIRFTLENWIKSFPYALLDGEIVVGDKFQDTTSAVMSYGGQPHFHYMIFDGVQLAEDLNLMYGRRLATLHAYFPLTIEPNYSIAMLTPYEIIHNRHSVLDIHIDYVKRGYEGTIIRQANGLYKYGRSTIAEGYMCKLKDFKDAEAIVVGFLPLEANLNESTTNECGYTEMSSHKEGMMTMAMLGSLVCTCKLFPNVTFKIGSGFTDKQRKEIWNNQTKYTREIVKFKYQDYGIKDKPREPIFLGWRDIRDL